MSEEPDRGHGADDPAGSSPSATARAVRRQYAIIAPFIGLALILLVALAGAEPHAVRGPQVLLGPIFTLLSVTALVWLMMLALRNFAVLSGRARMRFFRNFEPTLAPPDWLERPARVFDNLMQVPPIFYVVCVLMIQLDRVDSVQLSLAWLFVGFRCVHAIVFLGWNDLKFRFAAFSCSVVVLVVLCVRFAWLTRSSWLP